MLVKAIIKICFLLKALKILFEEENAVKIEVRVKTFI